MKKDYLGKILSFFTVTMFIGVIISVMTQIITRYLPVSYPWTEELSRLLFVAGVAFCAPVAYRDYEFVIVDILLERFPKKIKNYLSILINIAIIILFLIIFRHGISFAINGHRQMSATIGIPMSIPFGLIPFSAACLIYYCLINTIRIIKEDVLGKVKEV